MSQSPTPVGAAARAEGLEEPQRIAVHGDRPGARTESLGQWGWRRRWLLAAVALALAVRLVFAFGYWTDKPLTVDQVEYLLLADNLIETGELDYPEGPRRLVRSPGYPVFLAAVRSLMPGLAGVKAIQCLLGALSVLLIAALARRCADERTAIAAAFVAALYPPLVFQPAYVLSEVLYTALAISAALVLWDALSRRALRRAAWRRYVLGGVLAGLAMLTRPEFVFFLACFGLYMVLTRRSLAALVMFAAVFFTVLPWPIYNIVVQERVVLMSSRGGPNFWMGNNALALGDGDVSSNPPMGREYNRIIDSHPELSAEDLEQVFYSEALTFVRQHPLRWLSLQARKVFFFLVPVGPSYQSRSGLYRAAQSLSWVALLAMAMLGARRLERRPHAIAVLGCLAASVVATSLIFFPLARYRIPVLDPVLIVCAAMLRKKQQGDPARIDASVADCQRQAREPSDGQQHRSGAWARRRGEATRWQKQNEDEKSVEDSCSLLVRIRDPWHIPAFCMDGRKTGICPRRHHVRMVSDDESRSA